MTLLDDAREAFAAAIWVGGRSRRSRPKADAIDKAKKKLIAAKLKAYDGQPKPRLIKGEAWMAQCYSGDALQAAAAEGARGRHRLRDPQGGRHDLGRQPLHPQGAPNRELAHKFIDYLLRPDVVGRHLQRGRIRQSRTRRPPS